jgi:hypothetical protein
MNDEVKIWKETILTYFSVRSHHLLKKLRGITRVLLTCDDTAKTKKNYLYKGNPLNCTCE